MNQAMTAQATKNETTNPTASPPQQWPSTLKVSAASEVCPRTAWNSLKPVAANMTGIDRKNENSSAAGRLSPATWPAAIVAIERLVPGNAAARICAAPIKIDCG